MIRTLKTQAPAILLAAAMAFSVCGSARAVLVDEAAIAKAVTAHVETMAAERGLNGHGEVFNVDILQVPRAPFDFPEAQALSDIRIDTRSSLDVFFSPRVLVRVRMAGADGRIREVGVPVRISMSKPVWVAKTLVMPGQTLSENDFKVVHQEIPTNFDKVVGPELDIRAYAARIRIQPGQVLESSLMVKPPAVRRNTVVRVTMVGPGGLRMTVEGNSLEDGQMGQLVKVRNRFDRNKYYTARVVGENQVLVKM